MDVYKIEWYYSKCYNILYFEASGMGDAFAAVQKEWKLHSRDHFSRPRRLEQAPIDGVGNCCETPLADLS